MTIQKRFAVFDSDSHVVEPRDVWEKYLEPEYRVLGKYALWREDGKTNSYLKVNGELCRDTIPSNLPRHAIWRPGMTWDAIGELDPQTRHAMNEGAWDPRHASGTWTRWGWIRPCSTPPGLPRASTWCTTLTWPTPWRGRTTTGLPIFARPRRT